MGKRATCALSLKDYKKKNKTTIVKKTLAFLLIFVSVNSRKARHKKLKLINSWAVKL